MSWSLSRWVWQVEAPLSIGLPPSGSLNRCRLYVPARTLWGALTAALGRQLATGFPDYTKVGEDVRMNVRLTYLYPAEETQRGWCAWLPRYAMGKGLVWQREDDAHGTSLAADREMRQRLLLARPGTAIDPASDSATEGTLRETECIGQHWGDSTSAAPRPVGLAGYVFVREREVLAGALDKLEALFIGGDTRYGLGCVWRVTWLPASHVFGGVVDLSGQEPSVRVDRVLAHAQAPATVMLVGQLESLGGWDRAKGDDLEQLAPAPLWTPGSSVADQQRCWYIKENGLWQLKNGGT